MRVAAPKQGRAAHLLSWSRKSPKARTLRVADGSVRSWLGARTGLDLAQMVFAHNEGAERAYSDAPDARGHLLLVNIKRRRTLNYRLYTTSSDGRYGLSGRSRARRQ